MEATVGIGLDGVLFGCSPEDLIKKYGAPDKDYLSEDGDRRLCYHEIKSAFWFRENKLHWIRCAHPNLVWFGEKLFGRNKEEALSFLQVHLNESPEGDDYGEWESHSFSNSEVELQFDYNALKEVCFGHLFSENDGEPVWPVA